MAQAQKMESLGKLTGGVAHDFNNLLMVISGQAQLIRRRLDQPERVQTALEAIEAAAERGAQLTGHLLTFARRQRLNTEVVSIAAELRRVQTLLAASLPPGSGSNWSSPTMSGPRSWTRRSSSWR